jgi:hypothetical protein
LAFACTAVHAIARFKQTAQLPPRIHRDSELPEKAVTCRDCWTLCSVPCASTVCCGTSEARICRPL